jgi:hypothetical protein
MDVSTLSLFAASAGKVLRRYSLEVHSCCVSVRSSMRNLDFLRSGGYMDLFGLVDNLAFYLELFSRRLLAGFEGVTWPSFSERHQICPLR